MSAPFLAAVRHAMLAERMGHELVTAERVAATDPPDELLGLKVDPDARRVHALAAFKANRAEARAFVETWRPRLFPDDEEPAGG